MAWSGKDQNSQKKKKSNALHENAPVVSKNHARKAGMAVESSSDCSEMETETFPTVQVTLSTGSTQMYGPKVNLGRKFNQLSRKPSTELVLKQKGQIINHLQIKTEVYQWYLHQALHL